MYADHDGVDRELSEFYSYTEPLDFELGKEAFTQAFGEFSGTCGYGDEVERSNAWVRWNFVGQVC